MLEINVRARSAAAPDKLYALVADGARWPECSAIGSFELERPGETEAEGVGAIRVFKTGTVKSRELVVEAVPGRRFAYTMLSGMPLRDYRADVELTPDGDGTIIEWRARFAAKYPGTGWFYRSLLQRVIGGLVRGLAARAAVSAERPAA
ncbi:SRPBCC family protein [Streptosporangiaceae bacterium NEAU-GS5]|nr:SRPBCC family protein [Streptosporangiaceae bacterium NEAU-GS5]